MKGVARTYLVNHPSRASCPIPIVKKEEIRYKMTIKKKILVTAASFALTGFLSFANPTPTHAVEYTPENWVARSVHEVEMDLSETDSSYLLIWGDTLSVISEATGIPIQTLVDLNHIADRDFILAGDTLLLWGDSTMALTWSSMQEAIDFYEANILADNGEEIAEVALGSEFYEPESWELIENYGDTIVLSINNVGVGGKDIIEFVKGEMYTEMTFFAADFAYPERPTARQLVRNSDKVTIEREELNPIDPS